MALRSDGLRTKGRMLSICGRLFLEQGYHKTSIRQIRGQAGVSSSSFQNAFGSKEGALMEFMLIVHESNRAIARNVIGVNEAALTPVEAYALEMAVQLALCDLSESVRECYLEFYARRVPDDRTCREEASELRGAFGGYLPGFAERDFRMLACGITGMMRGCLAGAGCDDIALEERIAALIGFTFRGLKVPPDEVRSALALVERKDVRALARGVAAELLLALALRFEFAPEEVSFCPG